MLIIWFLYKHSDLNKMQFSLVSTIMMGIIIIIIIIIIIHFRRVRKISKSDY
jgi:hypothetical protein